MTKYFAFLFLAIILFACNQRPRTTNEIEEKPEEIVHTYRFGIRIDSLDVRDYEVRQGDVLSRIYTNLGFTSAQADRIVRASSELLPPRSLRPGMNYYVFSTQDSVPQISHIVFARSRVDFVVIDLSDDEIQTSMYSRPITLKRRYAEGEVRSSIWNALVAQGASPTLAVRMSDIFAWQIDFTAIQPGDRFQILFDMEYIEDSIPLRIGSIEGATFTHRGREFFAIPFEQDSVRIFFDEEGNSLRRAFLRSPLDVYRITSRFSNARFHPILRRYRPHHGVDLAAPTGTPIRTIGDGVVIERGYQRGGAGNFVRIRHNANYVSTYMHMSRFGRGIVQGARVTQGQIIGYVGATGLATGPHLCFRVHRNGVPINPLTMEAPPDIPVHEHLRDSFMLVKQRVLSEMAHFSAIKAKEAKKELSEDELDDIVVVLYE